MFIFSVKADKRKICIVLAAVLVVVTSVIVVLKLRSNKPSAECAGVKYTLCAATNEERVAFFSQFGWQVEPEPIEIKEVTIPATFNDVYMNYNKIQKEQGLDLMPYAGKACKQWVYEVVNYPNEPDVRGTILVVDNRVIGGDLSTTAVDGFMTGFQGEHPSNDILNPKPSSSALTSSKAAVSSKAAASSKAASSKASSSKPAASSKKPSTSSAIPANAWPTD